MSGLEQLSLVWQAVGRAVTGWTELAELKEGGQRSFQCLIQFLRLNNFLNKKCQWGASALASGQIWIRQYTGGSIRIRVQILSGPNF